MIPKKYSETLPAIQRTFFIQKTNPTSDTYCFRESKSLEGVLQKSTQGTFPKQTNKQKHILTMRQRGKGFTEKQYVTAERE